MDKKYFPINTPTSCQLKWTWSTIRLYDGTTSSCHRVNPDQIIPEKFYKFHNTSKKISDRQLMLSGQWPQGGCEYCKNIEDAGGTSDRMFHLKIPDIYPHELDQDPTAVEVTPRIVEIYFDNICNMSCIYCYDGFSSKIQQENQHYGRFEKQGVIIDNKSTMAQNKNSLTEAFWVWLEKYCAGIKRLHILGGEPFYQPQFDYCLDFFSKHPCPDLEFNVITNLKIDKTRLNKYLERIKDLLAKKHIKRFDLTASIDCFGPEQEYVRYGIDLDQWRENFQLLAQNKWIYLSINQTLSGLTIKTVPELLKFINEIRKTRKIDHYFSTVMMTHDFLHPGIFGSGFFSKDFDDILMNMPENTWQEKEAKKYMSGLKLQINSCERDVNKVKQLEIYLDEIDRRRKLDWRKIFTWLEKEIKNVV